MPPPIRQGWLGGQLESLHGRLGRKDLERGGSERDHATTPRQLLFCLLCPLQKTNTMPIGGSDGLFNLTSHLHLPVLYSSN